MANKPSTRRSPVRIEPPPLPEIPEAFKATLEGNHDALTLGREIRVLYKEMTGIDAIPEDVAKDVVTAFLGMKLGVVPDNDDEVFEGAD